MQTNEDFSDFYKKVLPLVEEDLKKLNISKENSKDFLMGIYGLGNALVDSSIEKKNNLTKMKYKAVIYCRISTPKQSEGDSPENQKKACFRYAKDKLGYKKDEIKVFEEQFTGKKESRPALNQLFDFVKNFNVKYVIIYDIDRFTRGGFSHYERAKKRLERFGAELFDTKEVIQSKVNALEHLSDEFGDVPFYDWASQNPNEGAEVMQAQQAKEEARKILIRSIPVQIENARKGKTNREAPYGFKNTKILDINGHPEPSKEIFELEAYFVRMAFELLLQGKNVTDICEKMNALGFLSRERNRWDKTHSKVIGKIGGNPMSPKRFWELIERPVYAGFICEKWTNGFPVKANHDGIVSLDTWNKANEGRQCIVKDSGCPDGWKLIKIKNNGKKRQYLKDNPKYPYKNLIICPECGKQLKASDSTSGTKKQKFSYYHCNRKHKYVSINTKELNTILKDFFKQLRFSKSMVRILEVSIREIWLQKLKELNSGILLTNERINDLRKESDNAFNTISNVSNKTLIKKFEEKYEEIENEILVLEKSRTQKEYSEQDVKKITLYAREFIENIENLVLRTEDLTLLKNIWKLIFPKLPSFEELRNQTAVIAPILEIKDEFKDEKNAVVSPLGIEPRS